MTTEPIESEFAEILATIATGLGIAAERIFGIFVSAQVVIGALEIVSLLLIVSGAYLTGIYTKKWCIKSWRDDAGEWRKSDNKETSEWFPWVLAVVTAFVVWAITEMFSSSILKMCCPEYTAMREIITLVIP